MHLRTNLKKMMSEKKGILKGTIYGMILGLGGLFLVTTKADVTSHMTTDTYTLSYWSPLGPRGFDLPFERMADQLCGGKYRVIDKTYRLINPIDSKGKWLISCKEDGDYR